MNLYALGVNHETAPIEIREAVSFTPDTASLALQELKESKLVSESIILSTCNRTELYFTLENSQTTDLIHWMHNHFQLNATQLDPYLYLHQDLEAIKHIMRVASGLNSLVLGEPQILGQLKDAYQMATQYASVRGSMHSLFQQVFNTAKQIRTKTDIGVNPISIAYAAVSLTRQFFDKLNNQTALLIGSGETNQLVARHLKHQGIGKIIIANRTLANAEKLAAEVEGEAIELNQIKDYLAQADIVISATGSQDILLQTAEVKTALKQRKNLPIFMVDISVPRDLDPKISDLENVYLYSVDDLTQVIEDNKASRQEAASEAELIVQQEAENFIEKYNAIKHIKPVIVEFRQDAFNLKDKQLDKALKELKSGVAPEEVLTKLANQLTKKLIHQPSRQLNRTLGDADLVNIAKQLLIK